MGDKKAIVLLSGGLDSTTTLAIAKSRDYECHALTVLYGQQHETELEAAVRVAERVGVHTHKIVNIDLRSLAESALTSDDIEIPKDRPLHEIGAEHDVPVTYVPARNTVLMSLALAWAESIGAYDLFLGVNVLDASGYPDCRPEFVEAFQNLANAATRASTDYEHSFVVHAPLIEWTKAEIIQHGTELGIDYSITHSCYDPGPDGGACRGCDACILRRKGFDEAGIADPTRYTA
jgi:7-cyano-7-deazaguanine synthase